MKPTNPRLLLLTKRFFLDGRMAATNGDAYSAMRAALLLDLSVEQALNLFHIDLQDPAEESLRRGPEEPSWRQLWQEASRLGKTCDVLERLPHYRELDRLHRVRNLVQHHAHAPDPAEAHRFVGPVEGLLGTVFRALYDLDFTTYALAVGVRNGDLRRLLDEASYVARQGHAFLAIAATRIAYGYISRAVLRGSERDNETLARIASWSRRRQVDKAALDLGHAIQDLRMDVSMATLGVPVQETGRFRDLAPRVGVLETADRHWRVQLNTGRSEEEYLDDAEFAVDYMTALVLAAQDAFPTAIGEIRFPVPIREQRVSMKMGVRWDD